MRAAAEVEPVALVVDGDGLGVGQVADQLGLEALALGFEQGDGVLAREHLAGKGGVGGDEFAHFGFDDREVIGSEGLVTGKIVVEAILDGGADGDLGAGEERLHGLRQHVRGVVADQLQGCIVLAGDEFD